MKRYIFISLFLFVFHQYHVVAQKELVRLWDGTKNKATKVSLHPFLPDSNRYGGMAVIVCPGGSYCWHDYNVEGVQVAEWLNSMGMTAFVLKYRVQGIFQYVTHSRALFGGHCHPDMIEDIQRAIQYIRDHAIEYNINPKRIGTMGFSAGGHLVMSAACFYTTDFISRYGIYSGQSLRPDFVASIYPVVSMSHPDTHKRSRRALLGEWGKRKRSLRDSLSIEKHVTKTCPPVFLVNCKDDPIVRCHNSELLDSALTVKGVPHLYVQYETGGHGFGASDILGSKDSRSWKEKFKEWINELSLE